ncbi:MAG: UbiA family prenyltransferase [Slackia sp.]|nr:UbiA family prenyltransferase [Slackia sp.]
MALVSMSSKKVISIVTVTVLFSAFAILLAGEWAPSVGYVGMVSRLCTAAGFVLFALSFVGVAVLLIVNAQKRKGGARAGFRDTALKLAREVGCFVIACIAYVGSGFVALAVIAAFDNGAPTPERLFKLLVVVAACIGVVVLYRLYRKKHPVTYDMLGTAGIMALFVFLTAFGFIAGIIQAKDVVVDLLRGPQTELCWLAEVEEERATGRYSSFSQDTIEMTFKTLDEREIHISVAENDRSGLADITSAEGVVWLTYFPESCVYVSAEPGMDDYLAAGGR